MTLLAEQQDIILSELEERWKQEEILWKQKSCVQWLKEGEKIPLSFINHSFKGGNTTEYFL